MSTVSIRKRPEFLFSENPGFEGFSRNFLETPIKNSPFTIGEALSSDPVQLQSFVEAEYTLQLAKEGDPDALAYVNDEDKRVVNEIRALLRNYQTPAMEIQPLRPVDKQPVQRQIPLPGRTAPGVLPVVEEETDYSRLTESLIDEDERKYIASMGVDPDSIYRGDQGFFDRYIKNRGVTGTVTKDAPWRVKLSYFPINITPREAKKLLQQESPDAEVRYIDPRNPELGIAVRDQYTNGKFVPLRPQFGYEGALDEFRTSLGQEFIPIALDLTFGKVIDKFIGTSLEADTKRRRAGRGAATAGAAGISAGFGRFVTLAYGKAADINDVNIERAFEDAGFAASLAGVGTAVVGSTLGLLGGLWKQITGDSIPDEKLNELRARIQKTQKEGTAEEFTSEELTERTKEAARNFGIELKEYAPTVSELTQDNFLKTLEMQLLASLSYTDKNAQLYQNILDNNSRAAFTFWKELTEVRPELQGITADEFVQFLSKQQKQYAEQAAEAAQRQISDIEEGTKIEGVLPEQPPEQLLTIDELGSTFVRDKDTGTLMFPRSSPEFLAQYDESYNAAKDAVAREIDALSGLKYDRKTDSATKIIPAFRAAFNAGEDTDAIMRTLGEVEASDVIKSMIPMRDGVSVLKQLLGVTMETGPEGNRFLKQADLSFGQLAGMQNALNSLFMESSDRGVRQVAMNLRDAVEAQIDDLVTFTARKQLAAEGIEAPTARVLSQKVQEIAGPLVKAQDELRKANAAIDRRFIKDLVEKEPSEIADFVLSSSPKQITQLLDQIYDSPDAVVRLQNIRQLVVEKIQKSLGGLPLPEQNKAYAKFLEKNEEQLEALFPESDFLKLKNFTEVQEQALREINEVSEKLTELEKELGAPPANIIREFLAVGRIPRISGKGEMSRQQFEKIIKENPTLRPYVKAITRNFMRRNFEQGTTGPFTMFDRGAFNVDSFVNFVEDAYSQGPLGTSEFSLVFEPLLGKEQGRQYAKDLRMLGQLLKRGRDRTSRSPMAEGSVANQTVADHLEDVSASVKMVIPPLTQTGRRVNAFIAGLSDKIRSDLLEVLADPQKLNTLIKQREKAYTRREFYKLLSALAISREVDIGSELKERPAERAIKTVRGPVEGVYDLFGRILAP